MYKWKKKKEKKKIACTSSTKTYFPPKPEPPRKTDFADFAGVAKRCAAAKYNRARRGEILPTLSRRPAEPSRAEPLRQGCPLRERGRRNSSPLPAGVPHFEARRDEGAGTGKWSFPAAIPELQLPEGSGSPAALGWSALTVRVREVRDGTRWTVGAVFTKVLAARMQAIACCQYFFHIYQ